MTILQPLELTNLGLAHLMANLIKAPGHWCFQTKGRATIYKPESDYASRYNYKLTGNTEASNVIIAEVYN